MPKNVIFDDFTEMLLRVCNYYFGLATTGNMPAVGFEMINDFYEYLVKNICIKSEEYFEQICCEDLAEDKWQDVWKVLKCELADLFCLYHEQNAKFRNVITILESKCMHGDANRLLKIYNRHCLHNFSHSLFKIRRSLC